MAADKLQYAAGNSASTTLSAAINNTDTSAPLTSDTNFAAKSGEGMVIVDEGQATEELAYATTKTGGALTVPLANRGLEGGSAQAHASGASVKGILTAGMWNNVIDALANLVLKTTGAVDTTKVVTPAGEQTLTDKTLTSPTINTGILAAPQFTTQAYFDAEVDNGNSGTADTIDWTAGNKQKSTVNGAVTYTFTAPSGPANLILKVVNGGSQTITWPVTVMWPGGTKPTLTTSGTDIIAFYYDGSNFYGQVGLAFAVPA